MYCRNCGKEFEGNFCPKCGTAIDDNISLVKEDKPVVLTASKPAPTQINGKTAGIIIVIAIVIFVGGMLNYGLKRDSEPTQAEVTTIKELQAESNYKTSGEWYLNDTGYLFAVEVDSYDGDIFQAGTYTFSIANGAPGKSPLYDIYIRQKDSIAKSNLLIDDPDFTVSGDSADITRQLKKGDYVYIIPYEELVYEPVGGLSIELNK